MAEAPRLGQANRQQLRLAATDLDSLIEAAHPARAIRRVLERQVLERMDLSRFYAPSKAVEGRPGQAATDSKILIALWLYALSAGVNRAREIDWRGARHHAYRWGESRATIIC